MTCGGEAAGGGGLGDLGSAALRMSGDQNTGLAARDNPRDWYRQPFRWHQERHKVSMALGSKELKRKTNIPHFNKSPITRLGCHCHYHCSLLRELAAWQPTAHPKRMAVTGIKPAPQWDQQNGPYSTRQTGRVLPDTPGHQTRPERGQGQTQLWEGGARNSSYGQDRGTRFGRHKTTGK